MTITSVDKTPDTAKSKSAGRSAKLSTDPLDLSAAVLTGSPVNRGLAKIVLFEEIEGCRIAYEVALADMTKILKGVAKNALMDIELATRYGAKMVIGTPENLAALRKIAPKISLGEPWRSKIGEGAAKWVETARVGSSSSFMLYTFTGFNALAWLDRKDPTHRPGAADRPYDGDDMTRCRRLLDAAPEYVAMMPKLAKKSANWKALVENWTQICDLMDQEAPQWRTVPGGRSPQTNHLMRQLTGRTPSFPGSSPTQQAEDPRVPEGKQVKSAEPAASQPRVKTKKTVNAEKAIQTTKKVVNSKAAKPRKPGV